MDARNHKVNAGLPHAISMQGALLATLAVILIGTFRETRTWVLLVRAGITFLLMSGLLRLVTAGVMQALRGRSKDPGESVLSPRRNNENLAVPRQWTTESPETMEKVRS